MCDLASLIPVFNPFLDEECRALLLTLCKSIRQGYWDLLQPKLSPAVLAQVEDTLAVLNGARLCIRFPYHVIISEVGHATSIALAIHYRCLDTIGLDLRYLAPNLNPLNGFATVQRRLKTYFNLTTRDLVQSPRVQVSPRFDGLAIINNSNNTTILLREREKTWPPDVKESTTRFEFHLRPLRLKCDIEEVHGKRECHWPHVSNILWDIQAGVYRPQLVYVLNHSNSKHLYRHVKLWCRFQQRLQEPIEVRNKPEFFAHEAPAIKCLVVFIPADTEGQLVAKFKYDLIRAYSHSGKARIDVYVVVDAIDQAGVFFGALNHSLDVRNDQWSEQCFQDKIYCASARYTAWSQFKREFKFLSNVGWRDDQPNWIDFSYRLPDRLPYRVSRPILSPLESAHGSDIWKSYFIELVNYSLRHADGTHALATLSIEQTTSSDGHLIYTSNVRARSSNIEVVSQKNTSKSHLIRRFETHFWTLTGNHWHEYPHRFKLVQGLYQPRTSQDPVEVAAQYQETKRVRSRSQSPIRKLEIKRTQ